MRVAISGACWSSHSAKWLYALETDDIAGLFALEADGSQEQRLFHTSDFNFRDLSADPDGDLIACSLVRNGGSNLAIIRTNGKDFNEITEGDSIDLAPSWVPGKPNMIVFQSAGIARNQKGQQSGRGPFAIHQLSIETADMTTLAEEKNFDLLGPKVNSSSTLFYIRRPYRSGQEPVSWWRFILDILLLPFRALYAIFQWMNFFSVKYTGRPLSTSGNAQMREQDVKQMMIWGNLIDASAAAKGQSGEDAPALVPKSWELVRQDQNGQTEVVARGVLSFDLCPDDSIIYSNGSAVYRLDRDGKSSQLLKHQLIEHVVARSGSTSNL
ncbi:MAG TPA: hypothetical protein VFC63_25115 [Blastocatellia bacterium]|nr:hypothetical protein [Blastocatellia bacterium]